MLGYGANSGFREPFPSVMLFALRGGDPLFGKERPGYVFCSPPKGVDGGKVTLKSTQMRTN